MIEPQWDRLPFRTDADDWKMYAEADTEGAATGDPPTVPRVWVENFALSDYASRIGRTPAETIDLMGGGALRWRENKLASGWALDGKTFDIEFGGAPGVGYSVSCRGLDCLLHLPVRVYKAREAALRNGGPVKHLGPPPVHSRDADRVPPEALASERQSGRAAAASRLGKKALRSGGMVPRGERLLKKWLP